MKTFIRSEIEEHAECIYNIYDQSSNIHDAAEIVVSTLKNKNTIFIAGNGGSAADSQHIAAELTGRFKKERQGLPAIALTTDTSAITAIANDYGYDVIFSRQLEALAKPGDTLIVISTSGNSENLFKAVDKAKEINCNSIGFLGKNGGRLLDVCDMSIHVKSENTARIQELHIMIGHIICSIIDEKFS